ncbi:hypothetical protein MIR68_004556 [Amoeboaphelidium protococcarum]|nr:hypothetical protein MIR68_004556 [Amoeboaphelidium protococcarum]KAI3650525.1 hypothetical protein MP228_004006 [Amoeboaphelidium protococcarum]KAI3654839.1 hypothetical protein MP228_000219 [Amoeboaphelidium protococcarum]
MTAKIVGLTKTQEEALTKQLKRNALKQCDELVKDYQKCCQSHNLLVALWKCKTKVNALNDCVKQYTTQKDIDRLRKQFLDDINANKVER